jgi:hypothetical protein
VAGDLAHPRVEQGWLIVQLQAVDQTRIGQFAQQRERLGDIDPIVVGSLGGDFDAGIAGGDAIDMHQTRPRGDRGAGIGLLA